MIGVVLLFSIIMAVVVDVGTAIGFLLGCYLWSFLLYCIVWLFYAMLDKKQKPDRTRFVLISAVVGACLASPFEIGQHFAATSDTSSQAASTEATLDTREREVQAGLLRQQQQEKLQEEQQQADYKSAIQQAVVSMNKAMKASTLAEKGHALHRIDVSDCPKEFRMAWVDALYDFDELERIDEQQKSLASDQNVDSIFIRQAIQLLKGSNDSAVDDSLTEEQQLKQLRSAWLAKLTESDRAVAKVAASYGVDY
jgi:hypothetical protein